MNDAPLDAASAAALLGVSIETQIACVKREIAMRKRVYPRWVSQGKMTEHKANDELDAMLAVLATLEREAAARSLFP